MRRSLACSWIRDCWFWRPLQESDSKHGNYIDFSLCTQFPCDFVILEHLLRFSFFNPLELIIEREHSEVQHSVWISYSFQTSYYISLSFVVISSHPLRRVSASLRIRTAVLQHHPAPLSWFSAVVRPPRTPVALISFFFLLSFFLLCSCGSQCGQPSRGDVQWES